MPPEEYFRRFFNAKVKVHIRCCLPKIGMALRFVTFLQRAVRANIIERKDVLKGM